MYKITFGPRIHYVLILSLIFLTLSTWTSGGLYAQISITVDSTTAPSCADAADGAINITASGGDGNYSYTWSGPGFSSTSADISNLNQGDYTITITDQSSNTTTETIPLDFNDSVDPTVLTSNMTVQLDANGQVTITAAEINNNSTDNCGIDSYSLSKSNFTCADVGVNNITLTVTDINGNSASEKATVTVEDNLAPSVETSNMTVQLDANGQAAITATEINNNSTDNCEIDSYSLSKSNFTCDDVGVNNITLTITDINGNSSSKTATLTVEDNIAPTVATSSISVQLDANGQVSIATADINNNSTDNCEIASYSLSKSNFTCTDVGDNTITLTVTDTNGNSGSNTAVVTIIDDINPLISAGADITVNNDPQQCEAIVNVTPATASDNCTVSSPTGTRDDGLEISAPYPVGTTIITWAATDANANTAVAVTQQVTVMDNEPPVQPEIEDILWGCEYTVETPITTDNCSGDITGTTNDPLTYSTTGTYNITWTFTDAAGNNSQVIQTIEIDELTVDLSKIDILCNGFETGKLTATVDGGVRPYSYIWKNVDNNTNLGTESSVSNLPAGTYSVTVKDLNNCEITKQIEIEQPEILTMAEPTSTSVTCFVGNDGTITVGNMSGGTAPYLYSLDNTNFQSETTFQNLTAGDYTIFVEDVNNCSLQKSLRIEEPDELTATVSKTDVKCFVDADNDPDGKITVTNATGGTSGYEYSIDGSNWQSTPEFSNLTEGTYSVYIRDDSVSDCIVYLQDITINQPIAKLDVTLSSTRTTTFGTSTGSVTSNPVGGTAGYFYEWRETSSTAIISTTKTVNNLPAGEYELIVRDSNGCATKAKTITIKDAIYAQIDSAAMCESIGDKKDEEQVRTAYFRITDATAVGGDGNYTYFWEFGENKTATGPGQHAVVYNNPGNKTIKLTVTDGTGATFVVTRQQYVGLCYEPCGQAQNFQFDVNGIYIGDINGNKLDLENNSVCNSGINMYLFLPVSKNVNVYNPYTEITFTTRGGGLGGILEDLLEVQEDFGCKDEEEIDEIYDKNKPNRVGDFIRLTIDPIEYECGDDLNIDSFYITYTNNSKKDCGSNNNGFCYSTNEPVTVPTPVFVIATPNHILCHGEENGFIEAKGTGGFAPYTFKINPNDPFENINVFNELPAGEHTIYIRDSRGNENSTTVTINQPDTPLSIDVTKINPECIDDIGTAEAIASGGTPFSGTNPYEYLWNDVESNNTATPTNLSPGEYTVTVTDANGCQAIETVIIEEPVELTVPNAGTPQNLGCGTFTTVLNANASKTGIGTWTIDTSTSPAGGQFADANNPITTFTGKEGTYTLIWTIANEDGSCAQFDTVDITLVGECSKLDFDGIDDHIIFGETYPFTSGYFSFEIWVKPESVSGVQTILSKKDKSVSSSGYELIINNGAPTFRWNGKTLSTSNKIGTIRWYHIAVIYNGTARLYVDGIDVGNTSGANPSSTTAPFMLGAQYDSTSPSKPKNYFSGWMEELRIWDIALTQKQLQFMMNQKLENNSELVKGRVLPMNVPENLSWNKLKGYYRLDPLETINGETIDISSTPVNGKMKNIISDQYLSAPLPYISENSGSWRDRATWDVNIGNNQEKWWDVPNGNGINGSKINWNIVETSHNINSTAQDIYLLGLHSKSQELKINGNVPNETGQGLTVTDYLKLDGNINLEGNSQLVQTEGSILDEASSGFIDIDQQGTANSFNYNYWTSPVSLQNEKNNSGFKIEEVLFNGENGATLDFNYQYHWADNYNFNSEKKRISSYWLNTFQGTADDYFQWKQVAETESINPGIGYSMKGTQGSALLSSHQNYTFRGKPHNGNISVKVGEGQNLLTGNPYPSAIDSQKFIDENAIEDQNFNGSLYFWDHFGYENTHYLEEYVGGYAVLNKSGSVSSASSIDTRINTDTNLTGSKKPGRYIPVGQGFFISTHLVNSPDSIRFKNSYRVFVPESTNDSQFHSQEKDPKKSQENEYEQDTRFKIRLKFESPKGYHRQILVTADDKSTNSFDLGYDAPLIENNVEDMYWMIDSTEFVIQAVPDFNLEQVLPIGIKISEEGEYTIKIDELENIETKFNIFLKDKLNDTYFNLAKADYIATAEELGYFNDRYEIVFKEPQTEEEEEEEEEEEDIVDEEPIEEKPEELDGLPVLDLRYVRDTDEIAVINPDLMNVDRVELYSISGQLIKTFNEVPTEQSIMLSIDRKLSSAVYIVKMYSGEESYSRKVIITN